MSERISYQSLLAENASLREALRSALMEIEQLKARLGTDSTTSSMPPSSDGLKKPTIEPALPRGQGKKRGGQPGHKGDTLRFSEVIDETVVHLPEAEHCGCGRQIDSSQGSLKSERRQEFDLPVRMVHVREHRLLEVSCTCGQVHCATFPEHVNAPVQYGSGVHALVQLLNVEYNVGVDKVGNLFANLGFGHINPHTVTGSVHRGAYLAETPVSQIKEAILESELAHADETGARVAGKLHWVHGIGTRSYTYLFCHEKRGSQALFSEQSITKDYRGILIHDFWKTYFLIACQSHGMCLAHILRELKGLSLHHNRIWSKDMHELLLEAYQLSDQGRGVVAAEQINQIHRRYWHILQQARIEEPPPTTRPGKKIKRSKGLNLAERLINFWDDVLRFATVLCVPFTNNVAERDIRPLKTKLKVAGCFRTKAGIDDYLMLRSLCSSLRKQKRNVFEHLKLLWERKPIDMAVSVT